MGWEWVQPSATVVVAFIGIGGTYLASTRSANATVRVAQEQITAKAEADHEERQQRRREIAYVDLARWLSRYGAWASMTMPLLSSAQHDPYPQPPGISSDPAVHDAEALGVYWSPTVRGLMKEWSAARDKLANVSAIAKSDQASGQPLSNPGALWKNADEHRTAMKNAEQKIIDQMSRELVGETNDLVTRRDPGA